MQAKTATNPKPLHFGLIMVIYLCGIFMGAIDTSVVTPARTVIQNGLGVGDQTGIWMITIYTLAYASSIPIMGYGPGHGRRRLRHRHCCRRFSGKRHFRRLWASELGLYLFYQYTDISLYYYLRVHLFTQYQD